MLLIFNNLESENSHVFWLNSNSPTHNIPITNYRLILSKLHSSIVFGGLLLVCTFEYNKIETELG